uniref:PDZ domain-containing protein n=1 Tax=Glossina pallidipes TaxID=7398 RepID=A0A1A9ZWU5_GLOPL
MNKEVAGFFGTMPNFINMNKHVYFSQQVNVSGDNPVFVESVKPGGAAHIAGLVAGDMILKVNGTEVRSEKHPTVVSYIKGELRTVSSFIVRNKSFKSESVYYLSDFSLRFSKML